MDKIVLDKEQLTTLTHFIWKRGFREPELVHEILDHFACKVEEVLQNHPQMNLQDAMCKAHESFGVMGFAPIVSAYQAERIAKQKLIIKTARKKTLTSVPTIITALLLGYFVFQYTMWASTNKVDIAYFEWFNILMFFAFMMEPIMPFMLAGGLKKYKQKGYFTVQSTYGFFFWAMFLVPMNTPPKHFLAFSIFSSCVIVSLFLVTIANYFIQQLVDKERAEQERVMNGYHSL